MGYSVFPAAASGSKTRYLQTLTSGTSWTVPAGVTYVNATLVGGGGGSGKTDSIVGATRGNGGSIISSKVDTTPGASISYTIGAGGSAGTNNYGDAGTGGTTTFTGATSAPGGAGGKGRYAQGALGGTSYLSASNGAGETNPAGYNQDGSAGGSGCIILEYWI